LSNEGSVAHKESDMLITAPHCPFW